MSVFPPPKLYLVVCAGAQILHRLPEIAFTMHYEETRLEIAIADRQLIATKDARGKCKVARNLRTRDDDWTVHLCAEFYGGEHAGWEPPVLARASESLNMSCNTNLREFHAEAAEPPPPPPPQREESAETAWLTNLKRRGEMARQLRTLQLAAMRRDFERRHDNTTCKRDWADRILKGHRPMDHPPEGVSPPNRGRHTTV